jgi:hypothetical protein
MDGRRSRSISKVYAFFIRRKVSKTDWEIHTYYTGTGAFML